MENKKYKLTQGTILTYNGKKLFRIEALATIDGIVSKGDLGGFIETEANLQVYGNAWVYGDARVYGDAWVSGNSRVYGNSRVSGDAWVSGNARVQFGALTSDMDNKYEKVKGLIKPLLHPDYYPIEVHEEVSGNIAKQICALFGEHILTEDCWCNPHIILVEGVKDEFANIDR